MMGAVTICTNAMESMSGTETSGGRTQMTNPPNTPVPPSLPVGYVQTSAKLDGSVHSYIHVGDNGWQACDGSVVQTPELAKVLQEGGAIYGVDKATGLPRVPDLRGKIKTVPVGWWKDATDPNFTDDDDDSTMFDK